MIKKYFYDRKENVLLHRISRLATNMMYSTDYLGRRKATTDYQIERHIQHTKAVKERVIKVFQEKKDLDVTTLKKVSELQEVKISNLLDCRITAEKILDLTVHPRTRFNFIFLGVLNLTFMELMVLSLIITMIFGTMKLL